MRFEERQGVKIPKVGFGTWTIGGEAHADRLQDEAGLASLRSALDVGYTHFDTAESYADGHTEELLGLAIQQARADRADLFLTSKVRPANLTGRGVIQACEGSLRRLRTEYLDLYLIHWPNPAVPLEDTFSGLDDLVRGGKVRHLGVSNFDLKLLERAHTISKTPLLTNQIPYNLAERSYAERGVLDHCQSTGILVTAYSPMAKGRLGADRELQRIAAARSISPHQVAIAWLCNQPGVITIPMSADPQHQRANLEAADVVLAPEEIAALGRRDGAADGSPGGRMVA